MRMTALVLIFVLQASTASAIAPASPGQILCANETVLSGIVVDAESRDCGPLNINKSCYQHFVGVALKVEEVLESTSNDIRTGDSVRVGFSVRVEAPVKIGEKTFPVNIDGGGSLGFPVTTQRITDGTAKAELVGKRLIVALTPISHIKSSFGPMADAEFAAEVGEPNHAFVYRPSDDKWVRSILADPNCQGWRRR